MNKTNIYALILAAVTLVTFLACLVGVVWAFFLPTFEYGLLMGVTCGMLAVFFGLMVRNDYYDIFNKK